MSEQVWKELEERRAKGEDLYQESAGDGFRYDGMFPVDVLLYSLCRYNFATRFFKKDFKVLEVGCGFGTGLRFLKENCKEVIGLDLEASTVAKANEVWGKWATVVEGSALDMPFMDNTFDALVAMDIIEHFPKENAPQFLREIFRVLKPGGVAILSTPRASELASFNRKLAHKWGEYTHDELKEVIEKVFRNVIIYEQNDCVIHLANRNLAWHLLPVMFKDTPIRKLDDSDRAYWK